MSSRTSTKSSNSSERAVKDATSALTQPLVTRPAYGQDHAQAPVAESGLPSAGPGGMPMPVNPGIPAPVRAPGQNRPHRPVAQSGLPSGDGGGKGMSLDKDIPGEQTFKKPEEDIRDFDRSKDDNKDKDPWRRDSPDDQLKERNVVDDKEDWGQQHDNIGEMGKGEWDTTIKTKYPYRDGLPHQHYASNAEVDPEFVAGLWLLRTAHELRITPGRRIVAARPEDILMGLNPAFAQRARSCAVALKRADIGNLRWIFSVNCGNGPKVVKLKAFRAKNIRAITKMDVDLSCSCPAWQWLGPEHHAQREDYLDGSPRGTASSPVIRDPTGVNRVCKHVAAVLSFAKGWEVPVRKGKG